MKLLFMFAILFLSTLSISAQSTEITNYKQIFTDDENRPHYVDATSLEIVKNGNKVFWSVFPIDGYLGFTSLEVNCKVRRLRIRSVFVVVKGMESPRRNYITPWLPNDNTVNRLYVEFACNSSPKRPLVNIPNSEM
jgi:hypothetical protein